MVDWTDRERSIIKSVFSNINYDELGPKALARCLIVFPWTKRYFSSFGDLETPDAVKTNGKVAEHGAKVLRGLERGVKNMDTIKETYAQLSTKHSEQLHVDPDNFRLLSDCITIVVSAKMGSDFTPEVQATFQKFLAAVVSALGRQYH